MTSETAEQDWPGQRRGYPQSGPGSVAGWGRRFLALILDWLLSLLVAGAFLGRGVWNSEGSGQWVTLAVFAGEVWLFTALLGGSVGQMVCGVTVRRTSGQLLGLGRALLRALLICLVIPPVIYNSDRQGLHDLAVDSIALRR